MIEAPHRMHGFVAEGEDDDLDARNRPHEPRGGEGGARRHVAELAFAGDELAALRRFVARRAAEEELGEERAEDLVLAVNELATNSIRYGGGRGCLRVWREQDTLLCEVRDRGHITEPFLGRRRPEPTAPGGRGLWLVNLLCDHVQIRSSRAGSAVRVHMQLT